MKMYEGVAAFILLGLTGVFVIDLCGLFTASDCVNTGPYQDMRLKCGEKLEQYSCSDGRCFILTTYMVEGYSPRKYKFYVGPNMKFIGMIEECK